ncbi:uncharacterized protein LOC131681570 [Topomyia yanbarensis]|uniref:uncharacterized protein LOC131681570 n=1 Tax=Topomyia yanbarensis TaxID=2498891 RepID=UPI00273B5F1A|nr:uncharacterized protein LOC131681570 [Topomyia yanbarensis]
MEEGNKATVVKVHKVMITLPKGITLKNAPQHIDVPESSESPSNDTGGIKRKAPIVRQAGEMVVPKHLKSTGEQPAVSHSPKAEWTRVAPPGVSTVLRASQANEKDSSNGVYEKEEDEQFVLPLPDLSASELDQTDSSKGQLDRIEQKMDRMIAMLTSHESSLSVLKCNVKDLRVAVQNIPKLPSEESFAADVKSTIVPRSQRRIVFFPVSDDAYLLRLEELVQFDEGTRNELVSLYHEAPRTSLYEYMRKNVSCLFENTAKYTWTGRPPNSAPHGPPSNAAYKMNLIELLITSAHAMYPSVTRDFVEKEFKRALTNFNESRYKRRADKSI